MKKKLKNTFKWLILVLICYSLMFTGITVIEQRGSIGSIAYKVFNADGDYLGYLETFFAIEIAGAIFFSIAFPTSSVAL